MPYMISSRSVTDGVSLLVIKSKLVYSSLIFVDDKLTLICLLIFFDLRLSFDSIVSSSSVEFGWRAEVTRDYK